MAIPLVGSPARPVNYGNLVTGDDSRFNASNGAWTNSGGTLSWDSSATYRWGGSSGSLKFIATTNGHYVQLPITGTFKSGVQYACVFVVTVEEATTFASALDIEFGLITTDRVIVSNLTLNADSAGTEARYLAFIARWTPSADRTGVAFRLTSKYTGTMTLHVGQCRVFRMPDDRAVIPGDANNALTSSIGYMPIWRPSTGSAQLTLGQTGGIGFSPGATYLENEYQNNAYAGVWASNTELGIECDHLTLGDMPEEGVWFLIGDDGLGLYVSEKDTTTLQMYSDTADNMTQLRHRGNGGWAVSPDGTINGRIEAYFDWVFTKSGALSVATNVALPYYRTPYKARITEVQVHVGTAPTGTNVIVDVNDDGTTIFTTQGNRPEIAVSTNDDTSGAPDGGTSVAAGSVITVDVDQVGSGTTGSDLTVQVRGYYIW